MLIAILLVLSSGLAHAVWNLFTKRSQNKQVFLWLIHIASAVMLLPFFVIELSSASIPAEGWLFIALSALFQIGYGLLLPQTYRFGDMSQMYPIMRGTGALFVPILSVWIYRESLSVPGWLGVGCIVAGLFAISGVARLRPMNGPESRKLLLALAVGCCITGYVMTDKMVLNWLSPVALIELGNLAYVLALLPAVLKSRGIRREWKANRSTILLGTMFSPGSYLLFLLAMTLAPLSYLAPIREIGTVFGTIFGIYWLKESAGRSRVAMSAVITAGILVIGIWGGS
ncbi:EamA family transporter [Paenibacillus xanthanilyticus]|uniref:EamA family transporter n=1 Tax=Paenibacillus xanthanilyticus TaxID=1783531 RepID=A0ABV8K5I8_9BACL